jgi:hypothetical protein
VKNKGFANGNSIDLFFAQYFPGLSFAMSSLNKFLIEYDRLDFFEDKIRKNLEESLNNFIHLLHKV